MSKRVDELWRQAHEEYEKGKIKIERKPIFGKTKWEYGEEMRFTHKGREIKYPLGELEWHPSCGYWLAEVCYEHGVDTVFRVLGGHQWQFSDWMGRFGIHQVIVRHEQAALYAAEAYAKAKRKPGVITTTAGPGAANAFPAAVQNWLAEAPIVWITGAHETESDKLRTTIQEMPYEALDPVVKLHLRITVPHLAKQFLTRAFKEALTPPYGTVLVEVSLTAICTPCPPKYPDWVFTRMFEPHARYTENWRKDRLSEFYRWGPDPALVDKALKVIAEAKSPCLLLGNEVYWDEAAPEIKEFAYMMKIPLSNRRLARGCISEKDPIHFSSRAYPPVFERSDLVILVGTKIGFFDNFGAGWRRCIQITNHPMHLWTWLPTETEVIGNLKITFREMIKRAKELGLDKKLPSEREEWFKTVQEFEKIQRERAEARAKRYREWAPLHPAWFSYVLSSYLDKRYNEANPIIIDGYCLSDFYSIYSRPTGTPYLDSSEQAGVGHGFGFILGLEEAMGEELAKRPAVHLPGDAGFGISGMEVETAVRERAHAVSFVWVNDAWAGGCRYLVYTSSGGKYADLLGPANPIYGESHFQPNIRYDKIAELLGAHGEWLDDPSESKMKEVFDRAFDAAEKGKPAVVAVDAEPTVDHRELGYSYLYTLLWMHLPFAEINKAMKGVRMGYMRRFWKEEFEKYGIPDYPAPDAWEPRREEEMYASD